MVTYPVAQRHIPFDSWELMGRRKRGRIEEWFWFLFLRGGYLQTHNRVAYSIYIYTYAGQAHLAIFIEQMLIETDCFHCISSNIY